MTRQIGTHGLFCIDDNDYAAYALAMQCNAEATDATLTEQNSSLEEYLGRPWISVVNTTAQAISDDAAGGQVGPDGFVGTGISSPGTTTNGLPTDGTFWPRGLYMIGASINWALVTPTANSYRQLMVFGLARINGVTNISTTFVDLYTMRDYQGDGGNNGALNVVGLLDARNLDIQQVQTFFSHANTGSTITVAAGGWRVWANYLGSGLSI